MTVLKKFRLSSEMDLSSPSVDYFYTPSLRAQRFPFYLESCGHFYANEGYFTEREGLKSYLIILTIQGCGYIRSKEKELLLARNRAVMIDCMDFQYYQTASDQGWEFVWIHFNGSAASVYCELLNETGIELVDFGEDEKPCRMFDEIFAMIGNRYKNLDLELSEKLTSLVTRFIQARQTSLAMPRFEQHRKDIHQALAIIRENYPDHLTIDDLSKHAHISKFHFVRIFKEFTGQTPYEFLMDFRINESKNYLLKTDLPVSEISGCCGFFDTSNFIRYFKRTTGVTPNAFRKDKGFIS